MCAIKGRSVYVFNIMADSKHKFGTKMDLFLLTYLVSLGYISAFHS